MTSIATRARLAVQDGVGTVGVKILKSDMTEAVSHTTSGITRIFEGDGSAEYAKTITLPTGVTQGYYIYDDGAGNGISEAFNIFATEGGGGDGDAQSGGGILSARVAASSLTPDDFIAIVQGEEKILTFIVEADGRFDSASAASINVKLKDPAGNSVVKNNVSITRVTEELDVQVFRTTLSTANTNALEEGLLRIEITFDTQKAVLTHSLKVIEAL